MALTAVEEALALVLADLAPVATERVPLDRAAGRVLAEDLRALRTQPPFHAAAMDGWALRAVDAAAPGARLRILGESAAGHGFSGTVGPGEAVRIFTGAPLPAGADTVVMQEATRRDGDVVEIAEAVALGRHVRAAGIDFQAGDVGLTAGTRLGYTHVGLIASMNHAEVSVHRRPRVAYLATGDELVRPGTPIGPDQIVCSNGYALAALIEAAGGEAIDLGIAPDDLDATRAAVRVGFTAGVDLLVTLGGASVGDHDHVHAALAAEGVDFDFWKIAMRPGKPLMFGRRGATRVIGLPGNPAASLVCAVLFVAPHVRALSGFSKATPPVERLPLARTVPPNDLRQDYLRARLGIDADGHRVVEPLDDQDSSLLSRFARADALVVRPPFAPKAEAGEIVDVVSLF
ncbi:MAG: molybdopterin molybdotransferase MoeA [Phyllobacteriaceae bacterium]|nr:molybdopterin molybdotransferase MoeA [Phyllobacteriaceae bacterium]